MFDKDQLSKKKGFIFSHSLWGSHTAAAARGGSRSQRRQLVTLCPQTVNTRKRLFVLSSLSPAYLVGLRPMELYHPKSSFVFPHHLT